MNPKHVTSDTVPTGSRGDRAKLLGWGVLMLLAGLGLAAAAGPPRLPAGVPRPDDALNVLTGATLPLDGLLLVVVDAAWAVWIWMVMSLLLEALLVGADLVTHGGSRSIRALRRIADRASVPLVRRAVTAAFAVQVISRGVPMASAQSLPPAEATVVVATSSADGSAAPADDAASPPMYVVQPGDTLWSIAEQAYGDGSEYRRLVDANVGQPMAAGQVFSARGVICPGWQLAVPGASWQIQEIDGQRWYTVRPGDSLSSIAASTLGDPLRWPELFELNRGATTDDGKHALVDANTIWPGLRLRLPVVPTEADRPPEVTAPPAPEPTDQRAASTTPSVADRHTDDAPTGSVASPPATPDPEPTAAPTPPPLLRTHHSLQPVALDAADTASATPDGNEAQDGAPEAAAGSGTSGPPWRSDVPGLPLALGGLGLAGAAGVAFGARRLRRLRPLPQEPESEVVVEGGFAEAQPAQDLTRGLHGGAFDPLTALVGQLQQFLADSSLAGSANLGVLAVRHGRSSTTITIRCGLAEQLLLLELAGAFAGALDADVDACVSADQDVLWRLARLRRTRLLPSSETPVGGPCLVPVGVLYDRQAYSVAWDGLGHVLIASLPGHGADAILTSLVAALTARRSPQQLRVWMLASARSVPAPLFELPHLERAVDPSDESALLMAVEDLRAELDARAVHPTDTEALVIIPELRTLGPLSARLALLAERALGLGMRFFVAASDPEQAIGDPLTAHLGTRMVLRMQTEEASVSLLGVADAAFLGGGGRLLLRLDGREPVELYGYQVAGEHLERLVKVMRSAYSSPDSGRGAVLRPPDEPPGEPPAAEGDVPPHDLLSPEAIDAPPTPPQVDADLSRGAAAPADVCQMPIQIFCFGSPRVVCAGQTIWPRNGGDAKPWELLLFLASQPAEGVSRDAVVQALWPQDEIIENLGHRLRQLRFRLRRQLQQVPGAPSDDGISLNRRTLRTDPELVYSDAQEFLALVRSVRINPGEDSIDRLEQARALYVGDLLTGPDVRRYAWLDERDDSGVTLREHFRRLFQNASIRLGELYTEAGKLTAAIDVYRELTEIDPADERLWRALFRVHAQCGDRDALMAEEQRLRETLRDLAEELDVPAGPDAETPDGETTREFQRLLAGLEAREPATA